jgi:DNA transformation protein
MFGGWGLYLDEVMFALIAGARLYFKVDAETRGRFAAEGSEPFTYQGRAKPVEMSYWLAPEGSLESPDRLLPWAQLGLEAARRTRRKKTRE